MLDRKSADIAYLKQLVDEEGEPTSLHEYSKRCSRLLKIYVERYEELESTVSTNSATLKNVEKSLGELTDATHGLVSAWTTANNLQKFIKWVMSFAVLGMCIRWVVSILPDSWFT